MCGKWAVSPAMQQQHAWVSSQHHLFQGKHNRLHDNDRMVHAVLTVPLTALVPLPAWQCVAHAAWCHRPSQLHRISPAMTHLCVNSSMCCRPESLDNLLTQNFVAQGLRYCRHS